MAINPKNVSLSVKNSKHQRILSTPLMIKIIIKFLLHLPFFTSKNNITPARIYITVQTIGITKSGIHCVGLESVPNQSIPKFTNMLPSMATTSTGTKLYIIDKNKFFIILIYAQNPSFMMTSIKFIFYLSFCNIFKKTIHTLINTRFYSYLFLKIK